MSCEDQPQKESKMQRRSEVHSNVTCLIGEVL